MAQISIHYFAHHIVVINLSNKERNTTYFRHLYFCLFFVHLILYSVGCFSVESLITFSLLPLLIIMLHILLLMVQRVLKILLCWLSSSNFGANKIFCTMQFISLSSTSNSKPFFIIPIHIIIHFYFTAFSLYQV